MVLLKLIKNKNRVTMTVLHNIGSFFWKIFKSIFVREKDCCK